MKSWAEALWIAMTVEHGLALSAAKILRTNGNDGHKLLAMADYDRMSKVLLLWAPRHDTDPRARMMLSGSP